jgi:hypothetical protein
VRLGTEVVAARVSQSRGVYSPVFSTTLGGSKNATPPSNFLLGDRGVDVNRPLLVDWNDPAAAVGRRHVERVVGHLAYDDEQPDYELRSGASVRGSASRSRSRC